jgi:hypothetical protein
MDLYWLTRTTGGLSALKDQTGHLAMSNRAASNQQNMDRYWLVTNRHPEQRLYSAVSATSSGWASCTEQHNQQRTSKRWKGYNLTPITGGFKCCGYHRGTLQAVQCACRYIATGSALLTCSACSTLTSASYGSAHCTPLPACAACCIQSTQQTQSRPIQLQAYQPTDRQPSHLQRLQHLDQGVL